MSDETPEARRIAELAELVQRLEQRVIDLTDEVQLLRAQQRPSRWRRRSASRWSSSAMWDDLRSLPLGELPDRLREGDHWDLLWRDEPEDRFDEDDPDDEGGSRVPAKPKDLPPDRSGGIALPLPAEERGAVWDEPEPDDWYVTDGPQVHDHHPRRRRLS